MTIESMSESKYLTAPLPIETMPPGVPYIIGNEAAERFCFYGMRTVLIVFMTKFLLDRQGNLAVMGEEEAKGYYHLFVAGVYFFPILGAILADAVWGKYPHDLLAFDRLLPGQFRPGRRSDADRSAGRAAADHAGGRRHQIERVGQRGRSVRREEPAPAGKGLRLVLLFDQLRLVLLHAADALCCWITSAGPISTEKTRNILGRPWPSACPAC